MSCDLILFSNDYSWQLLLFLIYFLLRKYEVIVWSSLISYYYLMVDILEVSCLRWVMVRLVSERNSLFMVLIIINLNLYQKKKLSFDCLFFNIKIYLMFLSLFVVYWQNINLLSLWDTKIWRIKSKELGLRSAEVHILLYPSHY